MKNMKKKIAKIITVTGNIIFVTLVFFLCFSVYSVKKSGTISIFGYHILRVLSESMEPEIKINSCIIVKETAVDDIEVGDVITFTSFETDIYGAYNTHRVYDIIADEETGQKEFITKGDAYDYPDRLPVESKYILGKVHKVLPFSEELNVVLEKFKNNKLYFAVIILPLLLCLLSYIYQLLKLIILGTDGERECQDNETSHRK